MDCPCLPPPAQTEKAHAGQLNKKDQIAESLKVPVLINVAHLKRGIRGAMRDGPILPRMHIVADRSREKDNVHRIKARI